MRRGIATLNIFISLVAVLLLILSVDDFVSVQLRGVTYPSEHGWSTNHGFFYESKNNYLLLSAIYFFVSVAALGFDRKYRSWRYAVWRIILIGLAVGIAYSV